MAKTRPSIPKGTRDFGPTEMGRREYIFSAIKEVFYRYGYQPIETPAMETLSTLLGKYGDEGDKLLFRVLNSGDFLSSASDEDLLERNLGRLSDMISEKGLRYDLTVPFARYVVQHQNEITFPFKRFQIQPVWRADRPQKGRYREFYQCDVDVIGSESLLSEVELIQIIDEVFRRLEVAIDIRINNRKILAGMAEAIGEQDRFTTLTVIIDKIEKIGIDRVVSELSELGIASAHLEKIRHVLTFRGNARETLKFLKEFLAASSIGMQGVKEMSMIFDYLAGLEVPSNVVFDMSLARGLNYYTGSIIEVVAKEVEIGSICGGGRYDDLTGVFGLENISGVGVSFGADRIYDVLNLTRRFPGKDGAGTSLLFVNFGAAEEKYSLQVLQKVRQAGIPAEIYPDQVKLKKQLAYANARNIPFVALVGASEMEQGKLTLKNMQSGGQQELTLEELIAYLDQS
jgi:histidyl-tRNA synthetase